MQKTALSIVVALALGLFSTQSLALICVNGRCDDSPDENLKTYSTRDLQERAKAEADYYQYRQNPNDALPVDNIEIHLNGYNRDYQNYDNVVVNPSGKNYIHYNERHDRYDRYHDRYDDRYDRPYRRHHGGRGPHSYYPSDAYPHYNNGIVDKPQYRPVHPDHDYRPMPHGSGHFMHDRPYRPHYGNEFMPNHGIPFHH